MAESYFWQSHPAQHKTLLIKGCHNPLTHNVFCILINPPIFAIVNTLSLSRLDLQTVVAHQVIMMTRI